MTRFQHGKLLATGAALGAVVCALLWVGHAEARAASYTACVGCSGDPEGFVGDPPVVSFTAEPSLANGACIGQTPLCDPFPCTAEGSLTIQNITANKTLWVKELSSGAGETEIGPGQTTTLTYGGDAIGCGDDIYVEIFDTAPGTPGRLAIAYYWLNCTNCGGG